MRRALSILTTLLVLSGVQSVSRGQDDPDVAFSERLAQARRDAQQAEAEKRSLDGQYSTAIQSYDATNTRMQNRTAAFNKSADDLTASAPDISVKTDFFNNVTSLRTKDDLDKWVEKTKEKWGAQSGPRIREFDAYNGTEYSKYYDENGHLMVTKVRGDYDLIKRENDDWKQAYKRAKDSRDLAEKTYNDAVNQYGQLQTLGSKVTEASSRLDGAQRRVNDFEGRQPNSVTDNSGSGFANYSGGGGAGGAVEDSGTFYSITIDGFKCYGGRTRQEAIQDAYRMRELNPGQRIIVTGPERGFPGNNPDGPVILDLPGTRDQSSGDTIPDSED